MAANAASGTPTPNAASAPSPPTRPGGRSRGGVVATVVVVVVIVVVLALLFLGAIPGVHLGSSGSGSSGTTATTYSQSEPTAQSAANRMGGTWTVFFAGGADSTSSVTVPDLASQFTNSTCPLVNAPSTTPTIPAYSGAYSTGLMTSWVFGLYQSSPGEIALIMVQGGQATVLGEVTAASCVAYIGFFTPLTATSVIDSSAAASAVASAGSAFVSANPSASASAVLVDGYSYTVGSYTTTTYPSWLVTYSTCGIDATSGTGSQFNATVNASSGAVVYASSVATVACGSAGALALPHGGGSVGISMIATLTSRSEFA